MIARKSFKYLVLVSALIFFFNLNAKAQLSFSIPDASGSVGGSIEIPIYASEITEEHGFYSFQFNIAYDSDILFIDTVETTGTLLDDVQVIVNPNYAEGKIRITGASVSKITGSGTLLYIQADLLSIGESDLSWEDVLFEGEGGDSLTVNYTNGSVTVNDIEPLPAPNLSSPANGETGVSISPVLKWQEVEGADSYNVQLSGNDTFTELIVDQTNVIGTSYNVVGLSYETTYYWRVSAENSDGTSDWSAVWSFTTRTEQTDPLDAPTLSSPSNGAVDVELPVTLDWNNVPGATSYDVQLSDDDGFSNLIVDENGITSSNYTVSELDNGTTYYWRARAKNASETSNWSASWSFTTVGMVPEKVILESPADGTTIEVQEGETSVQLQWFSTSNETLAYELEIATDNAFSQIVYSSELLDTFYVFNDAEIQQIYYWRVRAGNEYGWGEFSDVWSFNLIVSDVKDKQQLDKNFSLQQNFPNPFNPSTTISYNVPEQSNVKLEIFDALGRYIVTLVNEQQAKGNYEIKWIPENLSSGVYLYRFTAVSIVNAQEFTEVKSMVLMK